MSTEKSLDLNMLLRHCSWMIMVFLIFGDTRFVWDFIPKCEILFEICDFIHETPQFWLQWSSTYNQIWFHCQLGGTQTKKIAETLLFGWVMGFLVCGDVRFYSWCEILFRNAGFYSWKPSISDSNNHGTQWKMYSELLYNSSSNNQIRFERYPCPKILQIHCFLDDYGILEYLKCEILFKIMT